MRQRNGDRQFLGPAIQKRFFTNPFQLLPWWQHHVEDIRQLVDGLRHQPHFRITAGDQEKAVQSLGRSQIEQEGNRATIIGAGPRHLSMSVTRETRQRGIGAHQPDRHFLGTKAPGQRQRPMRATENDHPGGST